ncbi:alkene reductase [Pseudomonadota bacterium]
MSHYMSEYRLGDVVLKNHIVMAPMTRCRAEGNLPNALMATYYSQRASAGLIITEGTSPSPNGLGYPRIPGIFSQEQVEAWKPVVEAVHKQGGKIFMQLMHTGRISHSLNLPQGARVLAPSAIASSEQMFTDSEGMQPLPVPEAMTLDDIRNTIEEYAQAARNAVAAGFDGVEVHAANGYLLEQFIRPNTNQREDEYGGSIENRARFVLEVVDACTKAIGCHKVGIRLSPYGVFNEMPLYDEMEADYEYLAQELEAQDVVYVHLVDHSGQGAPEVPTSIKEIFRNEFCGTLMLSGDYNAERAEKDIPRKADLIAVGRPFLANPNLIQRWESKAELKEPDYDTFYTPGELGYTDYPTL